MAVRVEVRHDHPTRIVGTAEGRTAEPEWSDRAANEVSFCRPAMKKTSELTIPELKAALFGTSDARALSTTDLVERMLASGGGISDLVFSPGRPPQVERFGELVPVQVAELPNLRPEDTAGIAKDLIRDNETYLRTLIDTGSTDLSWAIPDRWRFRVNVFRQRGTLAIVMRMIAAKIPSLQELGLPPAVADCATLKNGIVLVTGPTGSGKSSTLAAIIDLINTNRADHILTIEDPVEFLHHHKKGTVHQRELHTDTPTFALALRAALRQAPKVILVGEMRDRETIEIALTAAETGHLVFSTLHTIDASKTVERIVGTFEVSDQQAVRGRLAASFRYFISQRLIPKKEGGRQAIIEMLKATMRTREYIENGEKEGKSLLDAMRDGSLDGMQYFDGELEKLVRAGTISQSTALLYATNAGNLRVALADVPDEDSLIIR
jgi:twitching motility protein PilT